MKINAVISPKRAIKNNIRFDLNILKISAFISFSVLCGVAVYICFREAIYEDVDEYFILFTDFMKNKSKSEIFTDLLISVIPYFLIMILLSTSVLGEVLLYIVTLFKTLGLGVLVTHIYYTYELKGIEYCFLIFHPSKLLYLFAIILLINNCCFTVKSVKSVNAVAKMNYSEIIYRHIIVLVLLVTSVIIQIVLTSVFSGFFDF